MTQRKKRNACSDCPGYHDPCLWSGAGSNPAHLIVVAKAPTWHSIATNKPFQGEAGRLFKRILEAQAIKLGLKEELKIYYSYAILAGARKPADAYFKNCRPNILRELGSIRGVDGREPVIIAVGPHAGRQIGLNFKKINNVVGRRMTISIPTMRGPVNRAVYPIISMKDLERQPGVIGVANYALQTALEEATGQKAVRPLSIQEIQKNYVFPKSEKELVELVNYIINYAGESAKSGPDNWMLAMDTETNTLHSYLDRAQTTIFSVAWDDKRAAAILVDHPSALYSTEVAWREIRRLTACPKPKVFHNYQFDYQFLDLRGAETERVVWDTQYGEHFIAEEKSGFYGLKKQVSVYAPQYAGYDDELREAERERDKKKAEEEAAKRDVDYQTALAEYEEAVLEHKKFAAVCRKKDLVPPKKPKKPKKPRKTKKSKNKKKKPGEDVGFSGIPMKTLLPYAAADADVTRLIAKKQLARATMMKVREDAHHVMNYFYVPAARTLAKMEHRGLLVDTEYLEELTEKVTAMRDDALKNLHREFSPSVSYGSAQQVIEYMRKLNYENIPGVKPGSTAEDNLLRYYAHYGTDDQRSRFVHQLLRYRMARNGLSNHIKGRILNHLMPDGRIHGHYNLTGTSTGRLSSSDPNLQNIPPIICDLMVQMPDGDLQLEKGFSFKKLFIPNPGCTFLNLDIKGAELRVYTAYSKDEKMIQMLLDGMDIHSYTTSQCFDMTYEEVLARKHELGVKRLRDKAKRALFAIFYGAGPGQVSAVLGGTFDEAKAFIQDCFNAYPGLQPYKEWVDSQIHRKGSVRTFMGRHRRFRMAKVSSSQMSEAKRQAGNMLIQSTAHDLLLGQLIEVENHSDEIGLSVQLQVHDSIAGSIKATTSEEDVKTMTDFFNEYITNRVKEKYKWLPVPFLYELELGSSYGELKEFA